jgi:hypothetical protein
MPEAHPQFPRFLLSGPNLDPMSPVQGGERESTRVANRRPPPNMCFT